MPDFIKVLPNRPSFF